MPCPYYRQNRGVGGVKYDKETHHRRSIRLKDYNYSQVGAYFVTICTKDSECLFGDIVEKENKLNEYGQIVVDCWGWLSNQYSYVDLDEWIIMPNHLHGIVVINDECRGGSRTAPTHKPLGRLIGAFKTVSTKQINQIRNTPGISVWQRNYYEHIIRNETELNSIREYVMCNPLKWDEDTENPNAAKQ